MGTLYDLVWDQDVRDPLAAMPIVTFVQKDDYTEITRYRGYYITRVLPRPHFPALLLS